MPNQFTPKRQPIYVIGPSIAYIPLTKDLYALVDREKAAYLAQWNWCPKKRPKTFYVTRSIKVNGVQKCPIKMHHEVYGDKPTPLLLDHINGNGLDNREANLRLSTSSQNNSNTRRRSNNTSGIKGVSSSRGKWLAQIRSNGKSFFLGRYRTKDLAAEAYRKAAKQYFGNFARFE